MKHFINTTESLVEDAIDGLVQSAPNLATLDGYSEGVRVVVRADWDKNVQGTTHVALISGGGIWA